MQLGPHLVRLSIPWIAAWVHYPQLGNLETAGMYQNRHCYFVTVLSPGRAKSTTSKFAAALATDPTLAATFGDANTTVTSFKLKSDCGSQLIGNPGC